MSRIHEYMVRMLRFVRCSSNQWMGATLHYRKSTSWCTTQWAMVESDHPALLIRENTSTGMLWPGLIAIGLLLVTVCRAHAENRTLICRV